MLPMKQGDSSPGMLSVPAVPRTLSDNGMIVPPLQIPVALTNDLKRPRMESAEFWRKFCGMLSRTFRFCASNSSNVRSFVRYTSLFAQSHKRSQGVRLDFLYDNPLFPYGSGVQGTESQGQSSHYPGHQNGTPVGDEVHKPLPRNRGRKRKFVWKTTGYTECSKTCGGGTQQAIVRCIKEHNQQFVLEKRCPLLEKPLSPTIRCNVKPCPADWVVNPSNLSTQSI
ncbi:hypothetical protein C0J52_27825 [Blattella germanica]|nr:hypothetical protein C0J52_27825 [Blattella germanica]